MLLNRRDFLKISSAVIAMPVIARASVFPGLIVPGITRVPEISKRDFLRGDARFADAIFSPGMGWSPHSLVSSRACLALPYSTRYEVRCIDLTRDEMMSLCGYKRDGVAVMWVSDVGMQSHSWTPEQKAGSRLVGTFITGHEDNPMDYRYAS
jgi:hypothetical protein